MKRFKSGIPILGSIMAVLCLLAFASSAQAAAVLKMDLDQLSERADRVFRGTVTGIEPGSVSVAGGELPTVTYEIAVAESFKGDFSDNKNSGVVYLTMLGSAKQASEVNGMRLVSALPELPKLEVGQDYVLFTTATSAAGLTAPVGLDQGAFKVVEGDGGQEMATNALNNRGLFEGPVEYRNLVDAIRGAMYKRGGSK